MLGAEAKFSRGFLLESYADLLLYVFVYACTANRKVPRTEKATTTTKSPLTWRKETTLLEIFWRFKPWIL